MLCRMDLSKEGNGRHPEEESDDPIMLPQQSLAFRYYFMLCCIEGERFAGFLRRVQQAAGGGFHNMLANLEARDVFTAAHKAFEVS